MKNNKLWRWVNLNDVLVTASGGTPSTTNKAYWEGGEIPWINSGALKDSIIETASSYITYEGLINSSAKIFPQDT